jgi:hypothetical protein
MVLAEEKEERWPGNAGFRACDGKLGKNDCGSKSPKTLPRVRELWFSFSPGGGGLSLD